MCVSDSMREPQRRAKTMRTSPLMSMTCLSEVILGIVGLLAAGAAAEPDGTSLKSLWIVPSGHLFHLSR
jgi:hypothetical protein